MPSSQIDDSEPAARTGSSLNSRLGIAGAGNIVAAAAQRSFNPDLRAGGEHDVRSWYDRGQLACIDDRGLTVAPLHWTTEFR